MHTHTHTHTHTHNLLTGGPIGPTPSGPAGPSSPFSPLMPCREANTHMRTHTHIHTDTRRHMHALFSNCCRPLAAHPHRKFSLYVFQTKPSRPLFSAGFIMTSVSGGCQEDLLKNSSLAKLSKVAHTL